MSQIKTGTAYIVNGWTGICVAHGTSWSAVPIGSWIALPDAGLSYQITSIQDLSQSGWVQWPGTSETYSQDDSYYDSVSGYYAVAIQAVPLGIDFTDEDYWFRIGQYMVVTAIAQPSASGSYRYAIVQDFTANWNLPLLNAGDIATATIFSRAMMRLDDAVPILFDSIRLTGGTAAPASGTWAVGDRCWNTTPSVGQPKGWICTVSGTPGTWVSEGNL